MGLENELRTAWRNAKSALETHARFCETCMGGSQCSEWDRLNDEQHNAAVRLQQNNMEIPDA